ncbi:MAG: DUF4337 family protein [Cytophagaceae bacterium]
MSEETEEKKSNKMETWCGLLLGVFAAILAIANVGGGKYGGDEIKAVIAKGEAYAWYQSKSIKENMYEGQMDLMKSFVSAGIIPSDKTAGIDSLLKKLSKKIATKEKEKNEIMKGSDNIPKEEWVQEVMNEETGKNEMGKVVGVKDWDSAIAKLGDACDLFDKANLFLPICLVMGGICLISPSDQGRKTFFGAMILLGLIGSVYTAYGFIVAP